MTLQHLPGVVLAVEEDEVEDEAEPLLDVAGGLITDLANGVANVIIKNIDNLDTLAEEKVRFFYEEITDAVEHGLETADFSQEAFEMWYNANVEIH